MPKFWFLLLKRVPVKVTLNCFMLLFSLKLLKKESREELAELKKFMAVQQPAKGIHIFLPSLFLPLFFLFCFRVEEGCLFVVVFVCLWGLVYFSGRFTISLPSQWN